jgi:nucleoside-diphosphate-sugar epimerase
VTAAPQSIVVTGGSGYLGSALVEHLLGRGHVVVSLVRPGRPAPLPRHSRHCVVECALGSVPSLETLRGCDGAVHAAYDFSVSDWDGIRRLNVDGSLALFRQFEAAGIRRVVFVSSRSAAAVSRSLYGRAKREVEEYCRAHGISVLRCGLVTSSGTGGLYGMLKRIVVRAPIIPLIGKGDQPLFLVRIEDFCEATAHLLNRPVPAPELIELAFPQPFTLRQILERIAASRGVKRVFLPIPVGCIRIALRALAGLRIPLAFREDNLNGLVSAGSPPDFRPLFAEGIAVREPLGA